MSKMIPKTNQIYNFFPSFHSFTDKEARHRVKYRFLKTVSVKVAAWFPISVKCPYRKPCRLSGLTNGRSQTLVKGKPLRVLGNSIRGNTGGNSWPKSQGRWWKTRTDGTNWFFTSTESSLPSGSKNSSTSYGRTYIAPCSRKGKVGGSKYKEKK